MMELIFVIVILGILAGVAIPRLTATREDAIITKARSDVASIRSSIKTIRARRVLEGNPGYSPSLLDASLTATNNSAKDSGPLFVGILDYPIQAKNDKNHWRKIASSRTGVETYQFQINGSDSVDFDYDPVSGTFDCNHTKQSTKKNCAKLTE
ncbi:MAG: ABC transporter permease [Proteobacteria bacterium]|nr:MAG: ABC transporter permease [Pseudomonadota bacterium]